MDVQEETACVEQECMGMFSLGFVFCCMFVQYVTFFPLLIKLR